jgi:hypothetical protein
VEKEKIKKDGKNIPGFFAHLNLLHTCLKRGYLYELNPTIYSDVRVVVDDGKLRKC